MNKKLKCIVLPILVLVIVLSLLIGGYGIYFTKTTVDEKEIELMSVKYQLKEHKDASNISFAVTEIEDFEHYIIATSDMPRLWDSYNTLILYEEVPFLMIKNSGRYKRVFSQDGKYLQEMWGVDSCLLALNDDNGKLRNIPVVYSTNPSRIDRCKYTIAYDGTMQTFEKELAFNDNFCIIVSELYDNASKSSGELVEMKFFSGEKELVYIPTFS